MNSDTNREDRIRARAHAIWQEEGEPHSRDHDHWSRASREIDEQDSGGQTQSTAGDNADREEASQLHEDVSGSPQAGQLGSRSSKT